MVNKVEIEVEVEVEVEVETLLYLNVNYFQSNVYGGVHLFSPQKRKKL